MDAICTSSIVHGKRQLQSCAHRIAVKHAVVPGNLWQHYTSQKMLMYSVFAGYQFKG